MRNHLEAGPQSRPALRRPLPPNRTYEQVLNHYLVEKAIATRLKESTPDQRKLILETMYDELFAKVPDHPRLVRQKDAGLTARANEHKLALVKPFIRNTDCYVEFGAGDCRFAAQVASMVETAYGIDISDQRDVTTRSTSANFQLVIYDGSEDLPAPSSGSVDVIFSDQLIEHFHPDDVEAHFRLAHKLLKRGGKYVFRTPHALTGPHDVSGYFSDVAEGFHLKEWTYSELYALLTRLDFSALHCYRFVRGRCIRLPFIYFATMERILSHRPGWLSRRVAKLLLSSVCAVAIK